MHFLWTLTLSLVSFPKGMWSETALYITSSYNRPKVDKMRAVFQFPVVMFGKKAIILKNYT